MTPLHIDGIIRIKNAFIAGKATVVMPTNRLVNELVSLLKAEGRIQDFTIEGERKKTITVSLSYVDKKPAFQEVKLHSKPGRKIYVGFADLKTVKGGKGLSIISTPKGLMTGKEAMKNHLGGELLIELW